ncbi:unnamed protein product [Vitrella brassicaformis CCMP3155]|uniref:Uncharacterized protein n=1 Tax=Vitrella brassicaformis (strain CCMP3155) TaxID=1169540 RepID=A0A0G4FE51_VITBC|nr:unnamed protein product [Vitrella brassicaformis CCMP3155]|eukprot:CEM11484.1 unnamed protein product [Vitrella brassicaformis CCMP3155]
MASAAQPPPPNRPTAPSTVPPLRSIAISKMAAMAMSADPNRRAALRSQISNSHPDDADTMLYEWRAMGRFLRLAFMKRLTPADAARPLRLPAESLPTATAFHQLPLALAIYKIISRQLTYRGTSLELSQADDRGHYKIGNGWAFRVVGLGELPGGHRYADSYKRSDPVVRGSSHLYPSFSEFLLDRLLLCEWPDEEGVSHRVLIDAHIGRGDHRYGHLLTDKITEDQRITVDGRRNWGDLNDADAEDRRYVIVSGHRPGETIAAHLKVWYGYIELRTTEAPAADRPHPLADRFPGSAPLWCAVLRRFDLESAVIEGGRVVG